MHVLMHHDHLFTSDVYIHTAFVHSLQKGSMQYGFYTKLGKCLTMFGGQLAELA